MPGSTCATCGAPLAGGAAFCGSCGRPAVAAPQPAAARAPAAAGGGLFTAAEIQRRAKQQMLPLVVLAFVGYLDYRLHRQAPVAIVLFVGGMAVTLFLRESARFVLKTLKIKSLPPWGASLVVTVPAAVFFYWRGKGGLSSSASFVLMAAIIGAPILLNMVAASVDPSLKWYYGFRNRYLPVAFRPLVLVVGGLLLTFWLVHGDVTDIKILFGKTASKAGYPTLSNTLKTVMLNIGLGFALLHEPPKRRGGPR
jgi:Sec-independent protein secretion pathway component TatC